MVVSFHFFFLLIFYTILFFFFIWYSRLDASHCSPTLLHPFKLYATAFLLLTNRLLKADGVLVRQPFL
jgi:hypothetical protein